MINKQLGSSECQRVNPSNLFANQVNDVKCENKGTNASGVSILLSNRFCNKRSIQGSNGGGQPLLLPDSADSACDIASCGRKTCSHSGSIRLMMYSKKIVHVDAVHRKLKMLRYVE